MAKESFKDNREYATELCQAKSNGAIHLGRLCKGEACSVAVKDCKGKKSIGSVHVHPHTKPYLNSGDVRYAVGKPSEQIMCVVGNEKAPWISIGGHEDEIAPFKNITLRCSIMKQWPDYEKVVAQMKSINQDFQREWKEEVERVKKMNQDPRYKGKIVFSANQVNVDAWWKGKKLVEDHIKTFKQPCVWKL